MSGRMNPPINLTLAIESIANELKKTREALDAMYEHHLEYIESIDDTLIQLIPDEEE
jgi:DNA-dependent RNA polymerase auxiliary subunit epsilon